MTLLHHEVDDEITAWPTVHLAATTREQACSLLVHAIHHLLFAKGQIDAPVVVLRKRLVEMQKDSDEGKREGGRDHQPGHPRLHARRRTKRVKELLQALHEIETQVRHAVECLLKDGNYDGKGKQKEDNRLELLVRFGQSPTALAKQQFLIVCQQMLSLPSAASGEKERTSTTAQKPARKAFGVKVVPQADTHEDQQDTKRLQAKERKLVRFLIDASLQHDSLGKALGKRISPTRSQIFLNAPEHRLGEWWIPRRSLRIDHAQFSTRDRTAPIERLLKSPTYDERIAPSTSRENLADLAHSPSSIKGKRITVEKKVSQECGRHSVRSAEEAEDSEATRTMPMQDLCNNTPSRGAVLAPASGDCVSQVENIDAKRARRALLRQLKAPSLSSPTTGKARTSGAPQAQQSMTARKFSGRTVTSAAFVLDFGAEPRAEDSDLTQTPRLDRVWHSSRVQIRGCT